MNVGSAQWVQNVRLQACKEDYRRRGPNSFREAGPLGIATLREQNFPMYEVQSVQHRV